MRRVALLGGAVAILAGCASVPAPRAPALGARIAATALAQVGDAYQFGGNGPDAFDCSGLVRFAHAAHGIPVPRVTGDQHAAARVVPLRELAPGDVLFFRFAGPKVSHVAIYMGEGRFVHAPQTGRPVESRRLDDPGYRPALVGAGRLY